MFMLLQLIFNFYKKNELRYNICVEHSVVSYLDRQSSWFRMFTANTATVTKAAAAWL